MPGTNQIPEVLLKRKAVISNDGPYRDRCNLANSLYSSVEACHDDGRFQ